MAGTTVDNGTGTLITFGTSAFTSELLGVEGSGISRPSIDTSHMGTAAPGNNVIANRTSIPGDLTDPGSINIELHFDPDQEPPIDQVSETITITFPLAAGDSTAAKWAATGYMTDFSFGAQMEDKMTATATIKWSGNITLTAAA